MRKFKTERNNKIIFIIKNAKLDFYLGEFGIFLYEET